MTESGSEGEREPSARWNAMVAGTVEGAQKEAETLRAAARDEAARIRAQAEAEAGRLAAEAQHDADKLVQQARARAARLLAGTDAKVPPAAAAAGAAPHRPRLLRAAAPTAAAVLTVSVGVLGVVLLNERPPGPCRSAQDETSRPVSSASPVGMQPIGAVARQRSGSGRLPQSWITGGALPSHLFSFPPPSESATTQETPSSADPAAAPGSPSATPASPTAGPSARESTSATGCR
ncbi:hypothetical protein [Streptomyces hilarionis]|uniref:hypothetical protein n=1 Tax=Streptomyces hilarionis TaxID=2839954 RepID=UPI00211A523E|nr:hypothetical protein [Streptomyces hilarionis]MCQ9132287.1 hypothetical protein [Streptomyces hilarionis]